MELTNLAKGTSIYQRYTLLERYHADKQTTLASRQDLANYNRWRARPTTITDERFDELLQSQQLTKEAFDLAVKELTDEEMNYIYQEIGEDGWVKETKNIFSQQDSQANDTEGEYLNFTYALRLHIQYFEEKLKEIIQQFPNLSVDIEAAKEFVGAVINQLMDIGLRTFVYDLHVEKEKMNGIEAIDEKEGFKEYLIYRFDTKEKIKGFFVQYPVLTRLYAEIIGFQLVNFTELLSALSESEEVLNEQFAIDKPIKLTGLKLGAGDSHDKGKSVAILTVDQGIELVYKPKNLEIGHRFDQFMKEIKKMNPAFDFYLTKKIIGDTYTFEERLVYSECLSEEEVAEYYRQFGQTIALVYLLNGNDFHLENVLSFGKYPVLIDLETIIQNHFPMPSAQNALMKVIKENSESVVMSGLVPVYLFEERSESDVEGAEKGIQLSALSGGEQKLPYKILKLVNFDSIHMQFQYEEHTMDASENIPMFRGEKVDFVPYIETIIAGFQEFSRFAIENREHLAILAEDIFSNCFVRNVIKTTQSYGDLLDYSTHPTCMVDYIEREKLFENLWSHGYSNAKPVPYEVRDMLQHDVPIFFNPTSGYDLVASQGERIRGMYEKRAIDREISKLKFYSEQEEKEQLDYLRTSFGLYHPSHLQTKEIPTVFSEEEDLLLTGAKAIGQAIFAESFIGEESIAWKDIKEPSIDNYVVGVMDENFYDGISGMYLYFSELYHVTHEELFKEAYRLAESLIIELDEDYVESSSAFYGSLAAVYPLLYNYLQTKEEKLLTTAVSIATKYMTSYAASAVQVYDWAGGGLLQWFTSLCYCTK